MPFFPDALDWNIREDENKMDEIAMIINHNTFSADTFERFVMYCLQKGIFELKLIKNVAFIKCIIDDVLPYDPEDYFN